MDATFGQELADFVGFLHKGIRKFGIAPIQRKIKELYFAERASLLKQKIFEEVGAVYGVSEKEIILSKARGEVTEAKVMSILVIHKHLNMTYGEIAVLFGCGESNIGRRIKAFNAICGIGVPLRPSDNSFAKIYENNEFMGRFEGIDTRVKEYKLQWQTKQ